MADTKIPAGFEECEPLKAEGFWVGNSVLIEEFHFGESPDVVRMTTPIGYVLPTFQFSQLPVFGIIPVRSKPREWEGTSYYSTDHGRHIVIFETPPDIEPNQVLCVRIIEKPKEAGL
jgi:hypothetical protein